MSKNYRKINKFSGNNGGASHPRIEILVTLMPCIFLVVIYSMPHDYTNFSWEDVCARKH